MTLAFVQESNGFKVMSNRQKSEGTGEICSMYFTHLYKNFLMYPSTVYNELTSMGNKKIILKRKSQQRRNPEQKFFMLKFCGTFLRFGHQRNTSMYSNVSFFGPGRLYVSTAAREYTETFRRGLWSLVNWFVLTLVSSPHLFYW